MLITATTRNGSLMHLDSDGTFDYSGDALGTIHGVIVGKADMVVGRPFHAHLATLEKDGAITTSPIVTLRVTQT